MKVEVEVVGVGQFYNLQRGESENYILIEYLGAQVKMPCTEEQVQMAVQQLRPQQLRPAAQPYHAPEPESRTYAWKAEQAPEAVELGGEHPVPSDEEFLVGGEEPAPAVASNPLPLTKQQALRPVAPRKPKVANDDDGIAQG